MKAIRKNDEKDREDLFGLLSMYKMNNTYFRVLLSEPGDSILLAMTDNPKNWVHMGGEDYKGFRVLKRLETGSSRMFIKFIHPRQLVKILGPRLNINIPENKIKIVDKLDDGGYYIVQTALRYRGKVIDGMNRLLNMNPHKKYEIIEKFLLLNQE